MLRKLQAALTDFTGQAWGVFQAATQTHPEVRVYEEQVEEDLWRSSRLRGRTPGALAWLWSANIRGCINLQLEDPESDLALARRYGFDPRFEGVVNNGHPSIAQMLRIIAYYQEPSHRPMLVHCAAGMGRTGVVIAILRVLFHGVPLETAIADAKAHGMKMPNQEKFVCRFVALYQSGRLT